MADGRADALWLRDSDEHTLQDILHEIERCTGRGIGLAGSLAQRALSKTMAASLQGQPLRDIDLLLFDPPLEPSRLQALGRQFRIVEAKPTGYVAMLHRRSLMWVDLFPLLNGQRTETVTVCDTQYRATTPESQVLYLAEDILRRVRDGYPVRRRWLDKLRVLRALPELRTRMIDLEFAQQNKRFEHTAHDAWAYIDRALQQKPTPKLLDWWFCLKTWTGQRASSRAPASDVQTRHHVAGDRAAELVPDNTA